MFTKELYPQIWENARAMLVRSPQAILLSGKEGMGKLGIALEIANWLLCKEVSPKLKTIYNGTENPAANYNSEIPAAPCGECVSCKIFNNRAHLDLQILYPLNKSGDLNFWWGDYPEPVINYDDKNEKRGKSFISVDDIRALDKFINLSSFQGGLRVIIIWPANLLNKSSANALLKNLEEPTRDLIYILAADQAKSLPVTIYSRCRDIKVTPPQQEMTNRWLSTYLANDSKIKKNLTADKSGITPQEKIAAINNLMASAPINTLRWLNFYPLWDKLISAKDESQGLIMMETAQNIATLIKGKAKTTDDDENVNKDNITIEPALNLFYKIIAAKINEEKQKKSSQQKIIKLFELIDEIIFFKKHLVFNLGSRQVFDRLLLKLAMINRLN